jgi:hypothetical protein
MADDVWGIDGLQQIHHWNGTKWTLIPGSLASIAVGGGQVWGINGLEQIYQRNGKNWTLMPGSLSSIAVSDCQVWGINALQQIYQWNGTDWTLIPGSLASLAVDGCQVWGINALQQIFRWNGTGWTEIPGSLTSIAAGGGEVWGINAFQQIFRWNGTGWTEIPGSLASIAVGGGEVWGINGPRQIYRWNGKGWTLIPGSLSSIVVSEDGQVWGINGIQQIYQWNGKKNNWTLIPGSLASIAVAPKPTKPPANLGSAINYVLDSACNDVTDLSVTINVTEDIVCQSSVGTMGFAFQLNTLSPIGANCVWQQFVIAAYLDAIVGPSLTCSIESWPSNNFAQQVGLPTGGDMINYQIPPYKLPGLAKNANPRLPRGYTLTISLATHANTGKVTSVTFVIIDNQGNTCVNLTVQLLSLTYDGPGTPVTSAALAPVKGFQLNFVGVTGTQNVFSSGAGCITYTASSPLTALAKAPNCAIPKTTGEAANTTYGLLPEGSYSTLSQSFGIAP